MYYPYFYGKRGEIDAIRDSKDKLNDKSSSIQLIFPIVDPCAINPKPLVATLEALSADNNVAYLIVNPQLGKLMKDPSALAQWKSVTANLLSDRNIRPTLSIARGVGLGQLQAFVATYPSREIGVSVREATISPSDLAATLAGTSVRVFLHETVNMTAYTQAVGAGRTVLIRDRFPLKSKNADYSGEEWYADDHLTFTQDKRAGFGDFTVLGSEFRDGGWTAAAVAIHMSFVDPSNHLWVQHFVSDSVLQSDGNSTSKLAEAMVKLDRQGKLTPTKFLNSIGLELFRQQLSTGKITSLQNSKSQQMCHHLHTVGALIGV